MALATGSHLGSYEVLAPLGKGGMGEVYRARDTKLGREVAIKVLPAELSSHADRLARFEREARTVAALNHPHIVVLHSMEEDEGTHFLTMELVDGQTLDRHITPGGLPVARVLDLGIALADALTAAHERGVIHRDLKPSNVMLTRDGWVKVLDFGLAKLARTDAGEDFSRSATTMAASLSDATALVGTVPYMAPEQIRGEALDARSDLFALGVVLYEMATGRRPFGGASPVDVAWAIMRDAPEPLASLRADLPADLDRIIVRCLEKNPRERFQTALDVANELRVLRRALHGRESPARPEGDGAASIAVLPFVNRSAGVEDEYFSDGLADELLTVLAKIRGLRVAARTSAFHFKGKDATIAEIGSALRVATVLEGSVRKAGNRVRISVQLVKVSDGYHLWSETYDRTLDDIFAVQDDIAHAVVTELRTTLLGEKADSDASGEVRADVARAAKGRATDPEAHRLYLLARHLLDRSTREDTARAIAHLEEALQRDPQFALGWAELSRASAYETDMGWAPVAEGYGRARDAVQRSLALEPDLAEGHASIGYIQRAYDWDWRGAEESYARALKLAPGDAVALRGAGVLARSLGRLEEAIALYRKASERDPLSTTAYSNLGSALHASGRFVEAESAHRKALELSPQKNGAHASLSLSLIAQGRSEEALAEAAQEPDTAWRPWALAILHHAMGHSAESDAALAELIDKHAGIAAFQIAEVCATRHEFDAAFDWLERAHAQHDPGLTGVKYSPRLRTLHGDPRWRAFLRKMRLDA